MTVTWLTQAGLLFKNENISIMVDPYLTDSVGEREPDKRRRIPVDETFFCVSVDVIIITHAHEDHLNIPTLRRILSNAKRPITFLAPEGAYLELLKLGGPHNYVLLGPHSVWSERGINFYGVHAEHSDRTAAGYIIDDGKETFYVSGDTLYNFDVIDDVKDLDEEVDYAFLPINGVGNNMNAKDAADFAYEVGAKRAVPLHYGLFDSIDPADFDFENALILTPYEETEL